MPVKLVLIQHILKTIQELKRNIQHISPPLNKNCITDQDWLKHHFNEDDVPSTIVNIEEYTKSSIDYEQTFFSIDYYQNSENVSTIILQEDKITIISEINQPEPTWKLQTEKLEWTDPDLLNKLTQHIKNHNNQKPRAISYLEKQ